MGANLAVAARHMQMRDRLELATLLPSFEVRTIDAPCAGRRRGKLGTAAPFELPRCAALRMKHCAATQPAPHRGLLEQCADVERIEAQRLHVVGGCVAERTCAGGELQPAARERQVGVRAQLVPFEFYSKVASVERFLSES